MKTNRIFSILAGVLALAACSKYEPYVVPGGIDSSKAAVTSFSYDETLSGAKAAGFTWDAAAAVKAGAVSFTVELTTNADEKNVKNGTYIKIVDVVKDQTTYSTSISGKNSNGTETLTTGKYYYARVRANYDGYVFSDWRNLDGCVLVGTGVVSAEFSAPKDLAGTATDTSIGVTWTAVPFAASYLYEYKASSASEWSTGLTTEKTSAEFVNLEPETSYDIRVRAIKDEDTMSDYATITVTTKESSKFNPAMTTAAQVLAFFTTEAFNASATASFSLENDVDLTGMTIPTVADFKGTLDGKGHSLKGVKLNAPLFTILEGTVKDLVVEGEFTAEPDNFGVIAGSSTGVISGCTNKATVTKTVDAISESATVAGIVGVSTGEISGCTNEGKITVTVANTTVAAGVAGIAGYQAAAIKNCTNKGEISFTAKGISAKSDLVNVTSAIPSTGGVVAFSAAGFAMEGCNNYGKITYALTAADEGLTAAFNRNQHGGVVGSPCGNVTKCNNYGALSYTIQSATKGTALGQEFIICVGGIGGGDYYFTSSSGTISNTNYTDCTNEGSIYVYSDASKSNSTVGGIVGWPGQEKATTTAAKNCTNKGAITFEGVGKVRVGGIEGGTGVMDGCENDGVVTIVSAAAASAVGSLCGFHSQGHAITNCKANGEVVTKVALTGGTGGLIGNIGNAAHTTGEGCSVNCKITTPATDATVTGFVVGYFNGTSQAITLGTSASPIKVAGSINGAAPSADNICGTKNATASHVINYSL